MPGTAASFSVRAGEGERRGVFVAAAGDWEALWSFVIRRTGGFYFFRGGQFKILVVKFLSFLML